MARLKSRSKAAAVTRRPTHSQCPTCGHEIVNEIYVDMIDNAVTVGPMTVKLNPRLTELMTILAGAMPNYIPLEEVRGLLFGDHTGETSDKLIPCYINHLRRRVAKLPVEIETKFKKGYRLVVTHNPGA